MNEFEFKLAYKKLCTNYGKNIETDTMQIKADMFFDKYRNTPICTFEDALLEHVHLALVHFNVGRLRRHDSKSRCME